MDDSLFQYQRVFPTTWIYLSSILLIGLFFKFSRFWSVRNFDLLLLIALAPGLLLVHLGDSVARHEARAARKAESEGIKLPTGEPGKSDEFINPLPSARRANQPSREVNISRTLTVDEAIGPEVPPENEANTGDDDTGPATANALENESVKSFDEETVDEEVVEEIDEQGSGRAPPAEAGPSAEAADGEKATNTHAERIKRAYAVAKWGYLWLFIACGLLLVRLLLDPTMVRRPLLEPNLTAGGMMFIGTALFLHLMANVVTSQPVSVKTDPSVARPGFAILSIFPHIPTGLTLVEPERPTPGLKNEKSEPQTPAQVQAARELAAIAPAAKAIAIGSHAAIVLGMILIGYRHFGNLTMGIAAASIYLMLPYTAMMTGRIDHVLPAALLIWAIFCYRRPTIAGMFLGLAMGVVYYPLFLLPLWISFYWPRGLVRFLSGFGAAVGSLVLLLFLFSNDFATDVTKMFGVWLPLTANLGGVWDPTTGGWDPSFRIPVLAGFVVLSCSLALWPAQKNLGTLLSCSAAVMVAVQFWHGDGGGTFMAWFLPPLLMTIFRPNLEDRVALTVLGQGWLAGRRNGQMPTSRAA